MGVKAVIIWQKLFEEFIQHLKIFQKLKKIELFKNSSFFFVVQKWENDWS